MFRTRWIRKLFTRQRRLATAKTRRPVWLRLESLEERVVPCDSTSLVAGNCALNFYGHGQSPGFDISTKVLDTTTGGEAHSGTVTCNLVNGNSKITLGTGTVGDNGVCDIHVDLGKLPDNLSVGSYHLEEDYEGNSHYFDCSGSGNLNVNALTTTIVTPTVNVTFNNTNTFNISVNVNSANGPATSGTVTLDLVNGKETIQLGTATVGANGVATLTVTDHDLLEDLDSLAPGNYTLNVTYTGSNPFASSSCTATLTVNPGTTTVVAPTVNVTFDDTNTFNITVNVSSPSGPVSSGTVTLDLVNGNKTIPLGTATVGPNGTATLTVTDQDILKELNSLAPGNYTLDVTYSGSSPFAGSSGTITLTVNPAPTTITLPPVNLTINNTNTFNITVNVSSPNAPAPSGTVTLDLLINGQPISLGSGTVGPNGTVTLTITGTPLTILQSLPSGQYQLVVNFNAASGSPNSSGSTTTTLDILPQTQPGATTTTGTTITITPGNGTSNFSGGSTTIPVVINGPGGPIPSGTVTITLLTPNGSQVIGSAPISGGAAAVPVTVPAGLQPGTYSLLETVTGPNGANLGSNSAGTLNVQPLNPLVAALELALDAAMIANMNNPGSVGELQMFSQVFLHQPVPTALPQLLSNIQSLLPQTGSMLFPALEFGSYLDTDLPIENPM